MRVNLADSAIAPRLLANFILDLQTIGRGDHDLMDALLLVAIVQGNLAPLAADPALQLAYAGSAALPADALRRPISVHALATSVGMPFETVRRRVAALRRLGACEMRSEGVIVPAAWLASPGHALALQRTYALVKQTYHALRQHDLIGAPGRARRARAYVGPTPVRICARLASDYYLRIMETLVASGYGVIKGLILTAVFAHNSNERLFAREDLTDAERTPARASDLAVRLGLKPEYVRRRLVKLGETPVLRRLPDGYIIPAAAVDATRATRLLEQSLSWFARFIAALDEFGILARWDLEGLETESRTQAI